MALLATISKHACHGGELGYYQHPSKANDCDMKFAVFTPPQATQGPVPVLSAHTRRATGSCSWRPTRARA